jgi:hypothetical protein
MRFDIIMLLILLSFCFGCSDSAAPIQNAVIIVDVLPWEPGVTGPQYEYGVMPAGEFCPLGKGGTMLFKVLPFGSSDRVFVLFDESLVRRGESTSQPSESHLVAITSEYVYLESRSEDNPYHGYALRLKE